MAEPKRATRSSSLSHALWAGLGSLLLILAPVFVAVALYQPEGFDPVPLPADYGFFAPPLAVPARNARALAASERLGEGLLPGPEDLVYDAEAGALYTGCLDGWIKRVTLGGGGKGVAVENWTYVGGRPLGLAFAPDKNLVVAEANEGLMLVKGPDHKVELLTNEAEGIKFGITDGVDVASDGTVYFTDASYKYNLDMHILDVLEGRPHGRLMSFHPSSGQTTVLSRDLYFANGVTLSPDEDSLIFCETVMRRCKRYHLQGEKEGTIELFIDNLPGFPDNIRYDGEGHYQIGLSAGRTLSWDILLKYPMLRKMSVALPRFVTLPGLHRDSGVLFVGLDGQPLALYSDPGLFLVTGGLKVGQYLYHGSLHKPYISRIDLTKHAADAT